MSTKLTLNIDKDLIEVAKKYARERHQSLSSIVQNYFSHLKNDTKAKEKFEITPNVKKLSGIINLNDDYNHKDDYGKHIIEKYS